MASSTGDAGSRARDERRLGELASGLNSAAIHLLRRIRASDATLGVTPSRLSALSVLVFGGTCTLGQLAAAEQVTPPTMTRIVTALEAAGLARRLPDPADRRVVRVEATARGHAVMQRGRRLRVEALTRDLERLSPEDLATLERAIALLEALQDEAIER